MSFTQISHNYLESLEKTHILLFHEKQKSAEQIEFKFIQFGLEKNHRCFYTTNEPHKLKERMKDSSENDFILISGLTVMASIACSIFSLKHGRINMLLYNGHKSKRDSYVKRTILMKEKKNEGFPKESKQS